MFIVFQCFFIYWLYWSMCLICVFFPPGPLGNLLAAAVALQRALQDDEQGVP